MKTLFLSGGPFFMSLLTILLVGTVAWAFYHFINLQTKGTEISEASLKNLAKTKHIGLFAMIIGILAQLLGLYAAFQAIIEAADVSFGIVVNGIKVSMITTLYGITIYLVSLLIWFILDSLMRKKIQV